MLLLIKKQAMYFFPQAGTPLLKVQGSIFLKTKKHCLKELCAGHTAVIYTAKQTAPERGFFIT
jgi:hypothetical protein